MSDFQLGVIGGGNMAEAILRGVIAAGVLKPQAVVVSEPKADRRQMLARELRVACVDDNPAAAACPHVLLAVKQTADQIQFVVKDQHPQYAFAGRYSQQKVPAVRLDGDSDPGDARNRRAAVRARTYFPTA